MARPEVTGRKIIGEPALARKGAASDAAKMARLRAEAPDLADLVVEGRMTLDEAIAALEERRAEQKSARKRRRLRIDPDVLASIRDPGLPIECYSRLEFCRSHRVSERFYRILRQAGLGPDEIHLGTKILISKEAAARWRAEREAASKAEAEAKAEAAETNATTTQQEATA
jgi:hypothetical protein